MNPLTLLPPVIAAIAPEIPNAISTVWDWFNSSEKPKKVEPTFKERKVVDTHKFTQEEGEFICDIYYKFASTHNQTEIKDFLNQRLDLHKSISSYRRVWRGVTKLPKTDVKPNFDSTIPNTIND